MGLFDIFKKKAEGKMIKVNAVKQDVLTRIMTNETYSGDLFEGLSDKQIKSLERTQQNPVFEITKHKVEGFIVVPKGKSCTVFFDNEKVGTIKQDEISEDKLNVKLDGFISGGKQKLMDSSSDGNAKLHTKPGRYVLYLK